MRCLRAVELVAAVQRSLSEKNLSVRYPALGLRDERDRPKLGWNEFVRQLEDIRPKTR